MAEQTSNWKQKEVITAVVAGAAAGAVAALAVAPKTGKEFRSDLSTKANSEKKRFGNACRSQFSTLKKSTSQKMQQLKSRIKQRKRKEAPGDSADYDKDKFANQNPGELHSNTMADAQGDKSQKSEENVNGKSSKSKAN